MGDREGCQILPLARRGTRDTVRILVVDDHSLIRIGLRHVLKKAGDFEIVGESTNGHDGIKDYITYKPDVVLMDIIMDGISGLETTRKIMTRDPKARIIILTMLDGIVSQAMKAGARGFLTKRNAATELIKAIQTVMRGNIYIDPEVAQQYAIKKIEGNSTPFEKLSRREHEIFTHLIQGHSTAHIAETLHLSPKTVRCHKSHIMKKLGIHSMIELAQMAFAADYIHINSA